MRKDLRAALVATVVLTVLLGGAYPLLVTGISQPLFGKKADGDPALLGTPRKGPGFFFPRPSATGYSTTAGFFGNLGPNGIDTRDQTRAAILAYARRERVPARAVPNDAAQQSASGVDPDISPANARLQAPRVARQRGVPLARVLRAVRANTHGRLLGFLGERTVNVDELNDAVAGLGR